jgi:hypothetical protein
MSISGDDIKKFAANPSLPGCYQCLPFENGAQPSVWNTQGGSNQPVNFYDPTNARKLELGIDNLVAAKALQSALGLERPANVKYYILAGEGQTTVERIQYNNWVYQTHRDDTLGDSMLPLWTSKLPPFPQWTVSCDHLAIVRSPQFQTQLYQILTGTRSMKFLEDQGMTLSLNDVTYSPREEISIILLPDIATNEISGQLELSHYDQKSKQFKKPISIEIKHGGLEIKNIRATMRAPEEPGAYRLSFSGSHATRPKAPAIFIVRKPRSSDSR